MKKVILGLLAGSLLAGSCQEGVTCPSKDTVKASLSKLINRDFEIEAVNPVKDIPGLCETVIRVGIRSAVVYVDSKANYVITGNLIDVNTKENLTQKTVEKYSRVPEEILKKLEELVNMTYGEESSKYVYYISDPDCPFCRRFSPMLKEWAEKNGVQIKVILYPLPIHPEAKPKSIAMICDKRGYDDMHTYTNTKNQCEEGKKAIEKNLKVLREIGITGTPTVIGMNGKVIVGLPRDPEELNTLIQ